MQRGIGKKFRIFQFFSLESNLNVTNYKRSWKKSSKPTNIYHIPGKKIGNSIGNTLIVSYSQNGHGNFQSHNSDILKVTMEIFNVIFWTSSQNGHRNFRHHIKTSIQNGPWKFPTSHLRCIQNGQGNCQSRSFQHQMTMEITNATFLEKVENGRKKNARNFWGFKSKTGQIQQFIISQSRLFSTGTFVSCWEWPKTSKYACSVCDRVRRQ